MAGHICRKCLLAIQAPKSKKIKSCPRCGYTGEPAPKVAKNTGLSPSTNLEDSLQRPPLGPIRLGPPKVRVTDITKDVVIGGVLDTRGMSQEEIVKAIHGKMREEEHKA